MRGITLVARTFQVFKLTPIMARSVVTVSGILKSLKKPEEDLINDNYSDAAKRYSAWWVQHKDEILASDNNKKEFSKWAPNMIKAFLGCDCNDGCKDHVKAILKHNLLPNGPNKSNVFHWIAEYPNNTSLLKDLLANHPKAADMLRAKNEFNSTPIEIAFLYDRKDFIKLARKICNVPQLSDLQDMQQIGYYAALKDEHCPEMTSLLLGQAVSEWVYDSE